MSTFTNRKKLVLLLACGTFAFVFCILRYKYYYYFGADAISFLAVTEHIAEGEWYTSINAYFSPLLSWLMVPIFLMTNQGILSFTITHFLLGMLAMKYVLHILSTTEHLALTWLAIPIAALLASCGAMYFTADFVFTVVVIIYMYFNVRPQGILWWQHALFGVLLYSAKAIGFYAFLVFTIIRLVMHHINKATLADFLKTIVVFLGLSALWIGIISNKQNELTVSTAGRYNKMILQNNAPVLHPSDSIRLLPPYQQERYTAWEDMYSHTKQIKIQHDQGSLYQRAAYVAPQVYAQLNTIVRHVIPILLILISFLIVRKGKPNKPTILLCSMAALLSLPYLLYFTEMRYLLSSSILLVLATILCLHQLHIEQTNSIWLAALIIAFSIGMGAYQIAFCTPTNDEFISKQIEKHLPEIKNQHYASYFAYQFPQIAYNKKWKNFGGTKAFSNDSLALSDSLKKHDINFLIYPSHITLPQNVAAQFNKVSSSAFGGYVLFQRK